MDFRTIRRAASLTHLIGAFSRFIVRPFTRAETLEGFSDWGYIYLGILVGGLSALLWAAGVVSGTIGSLPGIVRGPIEALLERYHIPPDTSVLVVLPVCWGFIYPFKRLRRTIGEVFAKVTFGILEKLVAAGEWCMAHRWASVFLVIILTAFVFGGCSYWLSERARLHDLERDYDAWLHEMESLLLQTSITQPEKARFADVESRWRENFKLLFPTTHPAVCLHQLSRLVFADDGQADWAMAMNAKLPDVSRLSELCRPHGPASFDAVNAQTLIDITRIKIIVRIAKFARDRQLLWDAFNALQALPMTGHYRSAVSNTLGTIYANALAAHVDWPASTPAAPLSSICANPNICAVRSYSAYSQAAIGFENCSFEQQRLNNNVADLNLRIALHFDSVINSATPSAPLEEWLKSRQAFIKHLHSGIGAIQSCPIADSLVTITLVTTAQTYAAIAQLLQDEHLPFDEDSAQAGHFLRLAYTLNRSNYPEWNLEYFCLVYSGTTSPNPFRNEISFDEPSMVPVRDSLGRLCQSKR